MKHIHTKLLAAVILILTAVGVSPFGASALTVAPPKLELSGDPGSTVSSEFELFNEQKETKTFYVSFENFEAQGETGTPNFVPGEEGLATWIKAAEKVSLKAGERKKVPFTVNIPKNADPGGYFAAIFWSTMPPKSPKDIQVSVGAKVGILVLLKVSGDIKEGGGVLEFSTQSKQTIFNIFPIKFIYRFQNSGSDRVKPVGKVDVKNIFGQTVASIPANENEGNVLPLSIRKFEVVWNGKNEENKDSGEGFLGTAKNQWNNFALGKYTADLNLKYGSDNTEAKASFGFWIIPWQLLALAAIAIVVLGFILAKSIKKYNQWIIGKALQGSGRRF